MAEFKDLSPFDQKEVVRKMLQCDLSEKNHRLDAEAFRQECKANSILPDKLPDELEVSNQFDYRSYQQIYTLQSIMDAVVTDADVIDVNANGFNSDADIDDDDGYTPTSDIMERLWLQAFDALTHLPDKKRMMMTAIETNEIYHFLLRFFKKSDHRGVGPQVLLDYTTKLCEKLRTAVLTDKNLPLQEFYDQTNPKKLRGQLKSTSNPIFKDTNELINFLENYLFF